MLQKTLITEDGEELRNYLLELKYDPDYRNASDRVVFFSDQNEEKGHLRERTALIREILPEIKIIGMTMPPDRMLTDYADDAPRAGYSFLLFERSAATLYAYDCSEITPEEAGKSLRRELRYTEHVAGVLLFSAGVEKEIDRFLLKLSHDGISDVPLLGAQAGAAVSASLCGDFGIRDHYIVAVVFKGRALRMYYHYDCGWKPIGKSMTITGLKDNYCVSTIDGEPAASIYEKYLGVSPDEYFVDNVREFPLMVKRGEYQVVRLPSACDEAGCLQFFSRVEEGESVRLSYGNPRRLIEETGHYAEAIRTFDPQAVFLIICENRVRFLGREAAGDIGSYRAFLPDLAWTRGFAAIMMDNNGGGIVNASILSVGFREGVSSGQERSRLASIPGTVLKKGMIPLDQRLAMFLEQTTRELEEMASAAESANAAKTDFLSQMSHEIRTPINAVLGMNEMILRESDNKSVLKYAENAHQAGLTLLNIISDILDFSKIEAGKMEITPYDYELASLINDLVNLIALRAEEKGLKFTVRVDPATPRLLKGDEIRVKQIITNLLTNAVKYTEKGEITLEVGFEKAAWAGEIELKVSVKDTGSGIRQENLHKLFEAFNRIDEKRARRIEGTGLGINITEQLLRLMGSRLVVHSIYGSGSGFSFSLRQEVRDWDGIGEYGASLQRAGAGLAAKRGGFTAPEARILVVDDAPMNLAVISGLLKRTRIQVDTATGGRECLERFNGQSYDMLFLDHRMPEMDGLETLKALKERFPERMEGLPVISLTANAVAGAREEYLNAGFTDYLTKPVMSAELEGVLEKYLPAEKRCAEGGENKAPENGQAALPEAAGSVPETEKSLPEGLFALKLLHTDKGIAFCGGIEEYLSALAIYASSIQERAMELEECYGREDLENYGIKIHALKTMTGSVGATELSDLAKSLEDAAREKDIAAISAGHEVFLGLYRGMEKPLSDILGRKSADQANETHLPGKKLILLVDDDRDFQLLCKGWLKKDYSVDTADSGPEALIYLKETMPDLILLDFAMPGMSGAETLARIRENEATAGVPVVFLTGAEDGESAKKAESLHPQGYLLKSIGKRALLSGIAGFLNR